MSSNLFPIPSALFLSAGTRFSFSLIREYFSSETSTLVFMFSISSSTSRMVLSKVSWLFFSSSTFTLMPLSSSTSRFFSASPMSITNYNLPDYQYQRRIAMSDQERLKKSLNVFMLESDSRNPYGPNYLFHDYMTKVVHKHNLLMNFVNLTPADEEYKKNEQHKYLGTLAGGLFGSIALAMVFRRGLKLLPFTNFYDWFSKWRKYIYGFAGGIGALQAYDYGLQKYNKNVCQRFLHKYLDEGIKNGFKDYKISQSKSIDFMYTTPDQLKQNPSQ